MGHEDCILSGMEGIKFQEFDSEVFGFPCYRVVDVTAPGLSAALEKLRSMRPLMVDAKIESSDLNSARMLMSHGFLKICTHAGFFREAEELESDPQVNIGAEMDMSPEVLRSHAANFEHSRFCLDPRIRVGIRDEIYSRWIVNSLNDSGCEVAYVGNDFCTFRDNGTRLVIDLFSVLRKRRKIGTRIMNCLIALACERGRDGVESNTEIENPTATTFYPGLEFEVTSYVNCFHYLKDNNK